MNSKVFSALQVTSMYFFIKQSVTVTSKDTGNMFLLYSVILLHTGNLYFYLLSAGRVSAAPLFTFNMLLFLSPSATEPGQVVYRAEKNPLPRR